MKRRNRLLLSLYVGFMLYSLLVLFFGNSGYFALQNINNYRLRLIGNNRNLSNLNEELKTQLDTLKYDSETIKIYARDLGFFEENNKVIRVEGFRNKKNFYAVGKVVKFNEDDKSLKPYFRTAAIISGIVVYFLLGAAVGTKHGDKKRHSGN